MSLRAGQTRETAGNDACGFRDAGTGGLCGNRRTHLNRVIAFAAVAVILGDCA